MSTETPTIIDEKQNFEELRAKKQEIDKLIPEIEKKNDICYQLYENIQYEKTKLTNYQNEINTRNNRLEELKSEYNTIIGKGNTSSKEQVIKLKTETIKAKLDELLAQKIPEAGLSNNIKAKDESEENEFKNLVHENINIIYTQYESATSKDKKEEKQSFKISKNTIFKTLKETACQYFGIENPNDYLLTDDTEAILYDEDLKIDEYMKFYSVRINILRLISAVLLRARAKIIPLQEDRLKETNLFKSKLRDKVKKSGHGSGGQYINEFINYYLGYKPYFLSQEENIVEKDSSEVKSEAKELDTSFIMLALTLVLMALTLAFIYRSEKDILLDNKKIVNLQEQFLNSDKAYTFDGIQYDITQRIGKLKKEIKGFVLVSSFHMIVEKVKECDLSSEKLLFDLIKDSKCYEPYYNRKNKKTSTYTDLISSDYGAAAGIAEQFRKYKSGKDANIELSLSTLGGEFDGSGYHADINLNDFGVEYNEDYEVYSSNL